ncbi:hypothetical protein BGZ98_005591 [Dissophora globulifera]|nr:hypothetical protein BGZ98_005591 [Dissophora globulifera]
MALESEPQTQLAPSARLSFDDFQIAITSFLKQTARHMPWTYSRAGQTPQGYLSLTELKHSQNAPLQPLPQATLVDKSDSVSKEDQLLLDDLVEHFEEIPDNEEADHEAEAREDMSQKVSQDFLSVCYHVVFSPSYQVPVLYFNAYRPDGTAISLEEIYESLVPEDWRNSIRNAGLNGGISQQDHPILSIPYFYMHPCETVSLLETIFKNTTSTRQSSLLDSYILTWLSFTGQAIGLTIPSDIVASASV